MLYPMSHPSRFKIPPILLLLIYLFIPLALILIIFDVVYFDGKLRDTLPTEPETFLIFSILFTLPHILASFFSFLDKEYITHYKSQLIPWLRYVVLFSVFVPLISMEIALYTYAIFTMIHVFFQQAGVSKSLMRGSNSYHLYWQWSGVLISTLIYLAIYSQFNFGISEYQFFNTMVWGVIFIFSFFGWLAVSASKTTIGKAYFWNTHFLPIACFWFMSLGYPILAVALPRIVHDITAFVFYVTHDHNRSLHTKSNLLYRYTSAVGLPIVLVSPVLAILLAYPLQSTGLYYYVLPLLMVFGLMHYYIESFIWKRGTPHMQEIALST